MNIQVIPEPRPKTREIVMTLTPDEFRYVTSAIGNVERSRALREAKLDPYTFDTYAMYSRCLSTLEKL